MTQQVAELVTNITPPEPPPRVPIAAADSPTLAAKWSRKKDPLLAPRLPLLYLYPLQVHTDTPLSL